MKQALPESGRSGLLQRVAMYTSGFTLVAAVAVLAWALVIARL